MAVLKGIVKVITNIILVILFIILAIIIFIKVKTLISGNNYFEFFGYSIFEVATGSMEPSISKNDIIITKKGNDYKVNDIITYVTDNDFITHRIISVNNDTYITKGDANNTIDKEVTSKNIVGKVIKVYKNLGIWKSVFTNTKILIIIFITLVTIDLAFSYDTKKTKENIQVEKINEQPKDITKEELKIIKENINDIKEDYTIRLDLTEIQKNINNKVNKKVGEKNNKENQ